MTEPNMDKENSEIYEGDPDGDAPTVSLTDEWGRSLVCYIERSLEIDEEEYLLLIPVDTPVEVFAWEIEGSGDEEILVDIEEDDIDAVFATAKAVLSEQNLVLHRTALTLTVSGELPDIEDEDIVTLEIGEGDVEPEEFQLLANFYYEEQEYAVYTPIDPLLFFARLKPDGEPELLSPDEFEGIRSQLEEQLFDDLD
jgi:hypothetical protein